MGSFEVDTSTLTLVFTEATSINTPLKSRGSKAETTDEKAEIGTAEMMSSGLNGELFTGPTSC
jgi:hypothetical protein